MDEIISFREDHGLPISGDVKTKTIAPLKTATPGNVTATHLETLELHQKGLRLDDIAEQRDLRRGTIMSHLELLLENGYSVELDRLVSRDRSAQILQAFDQTKLDSLTAIREIVGETISFDEIRLVRAWWRRKKR
jgi:ATP-dependent DNA helicase RecQ